MRGLMIAVGALTYDPNTKRLYKYGRAISIPPTTLRLLVFLMEHAERSFSTDELIARVWGAQVLPDERARAMVRSQIRRIRLAIEDDAGPWLITEAMGLVGYGLWVEPPITQVRQLVATR